MLRLLFVHNNAFFGQGISYPLGNFHFNGYGHFGLELTYSVYGASVFRFDTVASHPSESSEEPFREAI